MMPSMLLPRYLLAKLYHESGQNEKARQTAEEVLKSPVKVESSATREIIREMEKIISYTPIVESGSSVKSGYK